MESTVQIGRFTREVIQSQLKDYFRNSTSAFVVNYSRLTSQDMNQLRLNLKARRARLLVVKNSLIRRAMEEFNITELHSVLEGQAGMIFTQEDPVVVFKVVSDFINEHKEQINLLGGFLEHKFLDAKLIKRLKDMPSREVLLAQLAGTLKSPLGCLLYAMQGILRKFTWAVEGLKEKREKGT